jgi:hypothetical protein
LLQALGQNFAAQKDFDTQLTGATQLASLLQNTQNTASQARADAIKSSTELTSQAMGILGGIVTGQGGSSGGGSNGSGGKGSGSGGGPGGSGSGGSDASSLVSTLAPILLAALL